MAKFKFKLENVLKIKIRVEDLRKKELKEAEVRRELARLQLLQRQQQVKETVESCREQLKIRFDVFQANDYHKFITWLNKQVDLAVLHLRKCDEEVDAKRERLLEAAKERQILEKLKEKAFEEYKAEELRLEINFLDEVGTSQFMRQEDKDGGGL